MGFRINTNIAAMNALKNSTQTNLNLDNSLTKLSSGLRINKAADDASGMAIADSLRQQAQGLGQAIMNANDGIGVAQTADGALGEYTNIIGIIRTKAIQAASDGQTIGTRAAIQKDISRLMQEAQNIASTTSFNGQSLLNGAFQNKSFHIGAYSGETVNISIADAQVAQVSKFSLVDGTGSAPKTTAGNAAGATTMVVTVTDSSGASITVSSTATYTAGAHTSAAQAQTIVDKFNADAQIAGASIRATVVEAPASTAANPLYTVRLDSGNSFNTSTDPGSITLGNGTPSLANNFSTVDVTTRSKAEKTIIIADYALKEMDATRADIGSVQNQLQSTIRNISVTQVNVSAAESQIRDVDFAAESANFAKYNILAKSGTYAMAQANAVQGNVLKLLQ